MVQEKLPDNYVSTGPAENQSGWQIENTWQAVTVQLHKEYINTTTKPAVDMRLFRDGVAYHTLRMTGAGGTSSSTQPYEGTGGMAYWVNLPKYYTDGFGQQAEHVYTVTELIPNPESFPYVRNISKLEPYSFKITNEARQNVFTALKTWDLGGSQPVPVTLQLWRKVIPQGFAASIPDERVASANGPLDGTPEPLATGEAPRSRESEPWRYLWVNLPLNGNLNGDETKPVSYQYYAVEAAADVPAGFVRDAASTGTDIRNIALNIPVTATKVWGGQPASAVYFHLDRRVGDGEPEQVTTEPVMLDGSIDANETVAWRYTWPSLQRYAQDDLTAPYVYTAREVNADGVDYLPTGYQRYNNGTLSVLNVQLIPVTATMQWVGGDTQRAEGVGPEVYFTLHRRTAQQLEAEAIPVEGAARLKVSLLDEPDAQNPVSVSWTNQPYATPTNVRYIYSVVVTDADGVAVSSWQDTAYTYTASYNSLDPLTVTNTYASPTTTITATKAWAGTTDGETLPAVWLKLYRGLPSAEQAAVAGAAVEQVPGGTAPLATASVSWTGMPTHDGLGSPYIYTTQEYLDEAATTAGPPAGYTNLNGMGLDHHNVKLLDIAISKAWADLPQGARHPATAIGLYRAFAGSTDAPVEVGTLDVAAGTGLSDSTTIPNMPTHGLDANVLRAYVYTVDEPTVPNGYGKSITGYQATNTYTGGDPIAVPVAVRWLDAGGTPITDNALLPTNLALTLTGDDGSSANHTLVPDDQGAWATTFGGLKQYSSAGSPIAYTLTGAAAPGFGLLSTTGDQATGLTLTYRQGALTVTKSVAEANFDAVGDLLHYTITLQNTGSVALTDLTLVDNRLPVDSMTRTGDNEADDVLSPGETWTYTYAYTVVQADLDATEVENKVTITAPQLPAAVEKVHTLLAAVAPRLTLAAATLPSVFDEPGSATVSYTLENTGNVTLTGLTLKDSNGLDTALANPLIVNGSTNISHPLPGAVNQAALDAGTPLTFTATADAKELSAPVTTTYAITFDRKPGMTLAVTANPADLSAPGEVTYTYRLTNTGNTTLTGIVLTDGKLGSIALTNTTLAVGGWMEVTGKDTVSQAQLDAGTPITNTATATARTYELSTSATGAATLTFTQSPGVTLTKSVDKNTFDAPGTATYTYRLTNTGNVTLTGLTLTDNKLGSIPLTQNSLAPGGVLEVKQALTVTQAHLDAGAAITNVATLSAEELDTPVTDSATIAFTQSPAVTLTKSVDKNTFDATGTATYTYRLTNTGNVTLTGLTLTDDKLGSVPLTQNSLAPGGVLEVKQAFTVAQAHLDAGTPITNLATLSAEELDTPVIASATITFTQAPAVSLTKSVDKATFDAPGTATYTYQLTNTGNVTLTGLTLTDDKLGNIPLTQNSLAPGGVLEVKQSFSVAQTHLDAGTPITNVAILSAEELDTPATASATITFTQSPGVAVTTSAAASSYQAVGDQLNFSAEIRNTGNIRLTDLDVAASLGAAGDLSITGDSNGDGHLDVGETWLVSYRHTITQQDLDQGSVTLAVSAASPAYPAITARHQSTVNALRIPRLSIAKTAQQTSYSALGDKVQYTIMLRNTGNITLTQLVVTDTLASVDSMALSGDANGNGHLDVNETWQYSYTYAVTQQDLDNNQLRSTATAVSQEMAAPVSTAHLVKRLYQVGVEALWQNEAGQPETNNALLPASLPVTLQGSDGSRHTATLIPGEGWSTMFADVPARTVDGTLITYTLIQQLPNGYVGAITGDPANGFTLTNRYDGLTNNQNPLNPAQPQEPVAVKAQVQWADIPLGITAPASASLQLLRSDGQALDAKIITADQSWLAGWTGLRKYAPDGQPYAYTLSPQTLENYAAQVTGSAGQGFVATYRYTGPLPTPTATVAPAPTAVPAVTPTAAPRVVLGLGSGISVTVADCYE